jgi:TM2 domain-containing membrane protein YozV
VLILVFVETFLFILVFAMTMMAGVKTYDEDDDNTVDVVFYVGDFVPAPAAGMDLYQTIS